MRVTKTKERIMTTIKTKTETITIDDRIIFDYRRLMAMPSTTEGLDGITVDSCIDNGLENAKLHGFSEKLDYVTFHDVAIYFTVNCARCYEIV